MQLPPAELRILAPVATVQGAEDSLANIDTTILPDGCLAYVIAVNTAYRLHKDLTPGNGSVAPQSGPGAWVPESGSATFVDNVQFGAGVPGTVNSGATSASALPSIPLLSTDVLFGGQLDPSIPTGIITSAQLDLVTFSPSVGVRIQWYNPTGFGVPVPDSIFYYFTVYRPIR